MYDLAMPNEKPGKCCKCHGTGTYRWGATVNGKTAHSGKCHSCGGTGRQTKRDIYRNLAYNRYKIAQMV
jgi:DnaJ-class molecular chaperone